MQEFKGTENYIATEELQIAVNAAIALEKPLLIKGEPGTGKTLLAFEIAKALGKDIHTWHVKSTTTAQQGLYEYLAMIKLKIFRTISLKEKCGKHLKAKKNRCC